MKSETQLLCVIFFLKVWFSDHELTRTHTDSESRSRAKESEPHPQPHFDSRSLQAVLKTHSHQTHILRQTKVKNWCLLLENFIRLRIFSHRCLCVSSVFNHSHMHTHTFEKKMRAREQERVEWKFSFVVNVFASTRTRYTYTHRHRWTTTKTV